MTEEQEIKLETVRKELGLFQFNQLKRNNDMSQSLIELDEAVTKVKEHLARLQIAEIKIGNTVISIANDLKNHKHVAPIVNQTANAPSQQLNFIKILEFFFKKK